MKKHLTRKNLFRTLLVLFILAQFKTIDKTPMDTRPENDLLVMTNAPEDVRTLLKTACYDCHSNSTNYPWYSNIAPISWWIKRHSRRGAFKINYSEWSSYDEAEIITKKKESAEIIKKGWMPIGSYKLMHPDARLTDEQRETLANWFLAVPLQ